ncbi:hypothetical protein VOLCADRAFT_86139 [Volvox carteri f. nagariensis]|uniref:Uncharacterized protein n=1 Tax=Volvox carteri f. nagariensis TaxID=3068 RepID=D8THZ4_VOLCA|nr:uncharacterized protein VOLCADRAFT_86139 [Volvox carteri f. nagariensis]EFJ53150.1 hypothetical protein VOLCADRAFT_86139 [Volvox carteri f. nagariensis]|eukprot:XP_002946155.1 hypothetical protein VOLCADRAFT_86139 [Volvox carteri f. nagariensis]
MADPQRELWREARRHIGEYEARNSELTLDLQAAGRELQTAKDEVAALGKESQALRTSKDASDRATLGEHDKLQVHGVASLREEVEAALVKAAAEERERDAHLMALRTHLEGLVSYYSNKGSYMYPERGESGGDGGKGVSEPEVGNGLVLTEPGAVTVAPELTVAEGYEAAVTTEVCDAPAVMAEGSYSEHVQHPVPSGGGNTLL